MRYNACWEANVLTLEPLTYKRACEFIAEHHRHHVPPQGWKFGVAAVDGEKLVGVVTVGRPIARHFDDGLTLEVTRCCTDGTKNACSMLYSAAWRAAKALGYRRMITYILEEELGTSLRAANWKYLSMTKGGDYWGVSRERVTKHPTGRKQLWEAA